MQTITHPPECNEKRRLLSNNVGAETEKYISPDGMKVCSCCHCQPNVNDLYKIFPLENEKCKQIPTKTNANEYGTHRLRLHACRKVKTDFGAHAKSLAHPPARPLFPLHFSYSRCDEIQRINERLKTMSRVGRILFA